MNVEGKTVLITGAGRGIGYGIAQDFGEAGAKLIIHYNKSKDGAESLKELFPSAVLVQGDIRSPQACKQIVEAAGEQLDVLINNAYAPLPCHQFTMLAMFIQLLYAGRPHS